MPRLSLPEDSTPRIEVRFRSDGGRHAGGAWKVAYADFVTALMALFIVLWLMGSSQKVKSSVSGYFTDPRGYARTVASSHGQATDPATRQDKMEEIRKQIEQALRAMPEFSKLRDNVKFSVSEEGLRIDLLENDQGMFFVSGSPEPSGAGQGLLEVLAKQMAQLPNRLVVEGHTDAAPFRNAGPSSGYSNWELASDRANAARRLLHGYGVRTEQVVEVRGYADQRPYNEKNRFDSKNRRVSVVVKFTT
jgi:chemotaxis protein MotB